MTFFRHIRTDRLRHLTGASALGLALALGAAPGPAVGPAQAQATAPAAQPSDEAVAAFARAATELRDIVVAMEAQMQAAEDEASRDRMRQAATEDMVRAVEAEGLSVDDYNAIAAAAQQDERLARRINDEMEDIATN